MKKVLGNWQIILRLVILLVALVLIIAGIYNLKNYFHDRKVDKTQVTALIVKNPKDSDDQQLKYELNGKTFIEYPVDKFLHHYGELDTELKVYVETDSPERVFLNNPPKGESTLATLLLGWGILLALIVSAERKILKILKNINQSGEV